MLNIPKMKVGVVAVSRDCFPESLSVNRRKALVAAYEKKFGKGDLYECPVCIVESEIQMKEALADVMNAGCNALCVYLGNFGPEISETLLAKEFSEKVGGPVMFCAAAVRKDCSYMLRIPSMRAWRRPCSSLASAKDRSMVSLRQA